MLGERKGDINKEEERKMRRARRAKSPGITPGTKNL